MVRSPFILNSHLRFSRRHTDQWHILLWAISHLRTKLPAGWISRWPCPRPVSSSDRTWSRVCCPCQPPLHHQGHTPRASWDLTSSLLIAVQRAAWDAPPPRCGGQSAGCGPACPHLHSWCCQGVPVWLWSLHFSICIENGNLSFRRHLENKMLKPPQSATHCWPTMSTTGGAAPSCRLLSQTAPLAQDSGLISARDRTQNQAMGLYSAVLNHPDQDSHSNITTRESDQPMTLSIRANAQNPPAGRWFTEDWPRTNCWSQPPNLGGEYCPTYGIPRLECCVLHFHPETCKNK